MDVYSGTGRTSADDVMVMPASAPARIEIQSSSLPLVEGDQVRDWSLSTPDAIFIPYNSDRLLALTELASAARWLWPHRTPLGNRMHFGSFTYFEEGRAWWSWHQINPSRLNYNFAISFAEIATHNHFVLARGGKVFKQTASVIRLPAQSSEDDHLGLLGLLNSSVACFWLKQVCHNKGGQGINEGLKAEAWERFYAYNATKVAKFSLPPGRALALAQRLEQLTQAIARLAPAALLSAVPPPDRAALDAAREQTTRLRRQMISSQEELDWQCYRLYGLLPEGSIPGNHESPAAPELQLGERAFEIVLARRVAAGDESTVWFERHGSTPITELPSHWSADYRAVVERRIALIESDRNIGLIERPEFKRRWNTPAWEDLEQAALRDWLLDRLEQPAFWPASADTPPQLTTTNRLAEQARADAAFMQVAAIYAGHADFDPARLVTDPVAAEAVPLLPVQRYTEEGLRKRAQWQDTWALQRREDAGEAVGPIPVPPKYKSSDFLRADFWRLRGGLDVPKERFVSFPGAERGADGSLVIAWAGWNHLQLATALAGYYGEMKDNEGWEPARLQPLLAGLLELVPWLEQWHNDIDPAFGERMGTYYRGFVTEDARALGFTLDDLRAWKPAGVATKRGRKKAAAASKG